MKVGILGHGVVGHGVAQILLDREKQHAEKTGRSVELARVADLRDFSDLPYSHLFTKDAWQVVRDPQIDIVGEMMGGVHPAYDFVKEALLNGKHVVTSNKALVAAKGVELSRIAQEKKVFFLYEASVGGGIPVLHTLIECLGGNRVEKLDGILNGTTNYILSQMSQGGDYQTVLAEAQRLGYAERDPHDDVAGIDAVRKLAILCTLITGAFVKYEDIYAEGVENIAQADIAAADKAGSVIRLIAHMENTDPIAAWVAPVALPKAHTLAQVEDVFNGVLLSGDSVDELFLRGRGAGTRPTASAVVGDILFAAKYNGQAVPANFDVDKTGKVAGFDDYEARFLLRADKPVDGWRVISACEGEAAMVSAKCTARQLQQAVEAAGAKLLGNPVLYMGE